MGWSVAAGFADGVQDIGAVSAVAELAVQDDVTVPAAKSARHAVLPVASPLNLIPRLRKGSDHKIVDVGIVLKGAE